jgi:hypothetical protein
MSSAYYDWMNVFNFVQLDWTAITIPDECLSGGYASRLLLRGEIGTFRGFRGWYFPGACMAPGVRIWSEALPRASGRG